jgi:hypothetical protein
MHVFIDFAIEDTKDEDIRHCQGAHRKASRAQSRRARSTSPIVDADTTAARTRDRANLMSLAPGGARMSHRFEGVIEAADPRGSDKEVKKDAHRMVSIRDRVPAVPRVAHGVINK